MNYDNLINSCFKIAIDEISDCVLICDTNGKLLFINKAAEKLDGMTLEEVRGKHISELYKLDDSTSLFLRSLKNGGQFIPEEYHNYITKHGKKQSSVSIVKPVFINNSLIGVIGISKDFSTIEKLHQRIIDLQEQLYINNNKKKYLPHYTFSDLIGSNKTFINSINIAKKAAENSAPVLINGETGTGKEIIAQSIHNNCLRRNKPFLAVNCSAIPENLLEGILFGTVKGAFTGAVNRSGIFEQASEGTVFLDELNNMSLNMQSKILRVIEEGYIRRVGDTKDIAVFPRVIAALNLNPVKAMEKNELRKDLFFRLGVMQIPLMPLRERKDDINELTKFFINKCSKEKKFKIKGVSSDVWNIFYEYSWPGNVRELKHCIEYAVNVLDAEVIETVHLPPHMMWNTRDSDNKLVLDLNTDNTIEEIKRMVEKKVIENILAKHRGKLVDTARHLGLSRQSLEYRLKKYDINYNNYK